MSILGTIGAFGAQALNVYGGIQLAKAGAVPAIRLADIQGKAPGADNPYIPNFLEFGLTGNQLEGGCTTKARTRRLTVTIDNATGEVVSVCPAKRRKRRRRLATCSDIADLQQLKGIFGKGTGMQAWIAKNGCT